MDRGDSVMRFLMEKILVWIVALLVVACVATPSSAGGGATMMMAMGGPPAAGMPSYLFEENFDGATACGGGDTNCNNGWTVGNGNTPDFNYTTAPAPLQGTYSAYLVATSTGALNSTRNTTNYTTANPIYWYGIVNIGIIDNVQTADVNKVLWIADSSNGAACTLGLRTTGGNIRWAVQSGGGTAYTAITPSNGTTYHLWGEYYLAAGTGYCHLYVSTDGTKPGTPSASRTSLTVSNIPVRIEMSASDNVVSVGRTTNTVFDRLLIDDVTIGSNP